MKKNKYLTLIIVFFVFFTTGCSFSKSKDTYKYNENAKYDIYLNHVGNIGFIQIENIEKDNIKHGDLKYINLKNNKRMVYRLVHSSDNKVYGSINPPGSAMANRLVVLKNGTIEKEIVFEGKEFHGPNIIVNDIENNKAYVQFASSNSLIKPSGTNFKIIDNTNDEVYECPFYVKGGLDSYDIYGNHIYGIVGGSKLCLYEDVPDSHIIKINRNTLETEIITENDIEYLGNDIKISPKGKIYILSNRSSHDDNLFAKYNCICIYDLEGTFLKKVELKRWCDKIIIDKLGIAYISQRGLATPSDDMGESIIIFDTNTDEIIKTIDGLNGPTTMDLVDNYLFIYTCQKQSITIMNTNNHEILGEIPIGIKGFCYSMVVLKND